MLFYQFLCKTVLLQHDLIIMKASGNILTQPKENDSQKVYLHLSYFSLCLAHAHPDVPCQTELVAGMRTNFEKCTIRCQHSEALKTVCLFLYSQQSIHLVLWLLISIPKYRFSRRFPLICPLNIFTEIYKNVSQIHGSTIFLSKNQQIISNVQK